jgi:hypothetical protein
MKVKPIDNVPLASSESSTSRSSIPTGKPLPSVASKFFVVDGNGRMIDTTLREVLGFTLFASSPLQASYMRKKLRIGMESPETTSHTALLAVLALFSVGDAATAAASTTAFAWPVLRIILGCIAFACSCVLMSRNRIHPIILQRILASTACLLVRPHSNR